MALLILLRHAKAVRDHEAPSDRARALTARGRRDAAAAAQAITEQGFAPGVVIASSAARTRETAAIAGDALGVAQTTLHDTLYLAEAATIWNAARAGFAPGALVVGHNPGIHELVARLIDRSGDVSALALRLREDFPTAAWAAFETEDEDLASARARLVGGWSPKSA